MLFACFISFPISRSRNNRGQREIPGSIWILFVAPFALVTATEGACDLAITWLESWNPLSRGGDSSDRVPLFLLLSPRTPLSSFWFPVPRCFRLAHSWISFFEKISYDYCLIIVANNSKKFLTTVLYSFKKYYTLRFQEIFIVSDILKSLK